MARPRRPPSQGWKTFLRNNADGIALVDLFVVPTISFRLLYGLLSLRHDRRNILLLGVTGHPTTDWITRQLNEAIGWEFTPKYLVRDRDRGYGEVFTPRVRAMGIHDRPAPPKSPSRNGHTERLIGSNVLIMLLPSASDTCATYFVRTCAIQWHSHTSVVGQRYTRTASCPGRWKHSADTNSRQFAAPLCSNFVFDKDSLKQPCATADNAWKRRTIPRQR